MEWRVEEPSTPGAGMSLAWMVLFPGKETPIHRHPNCNEALTLMDGAIEEKIDGKSFVPRPGETLYAPAGAAHQVINAGKTEARMMVAYSQGERVFEALGKF